MVTKRNAKKIKKVVKSLKKASQSHKRQAKTLSSIMKKRAEL